VVTSALRFLALVGVAMYCGHQWRIRVAPRWGASLGMLADAVGALSIVLACSEALGSFGAFRYWPLLACVTVAACGGRLLPTQGQANGSPATRRQFTGTERVVMASTLALVSAQWSTWIARAFSTGIGAGGGPANGDSLWYHMPLAAGFVQSGWTSRALFLNGEALVTYYPANTSLLHAIAMSALHSDVFSVFVNVVLAALALLAAWCIGETVGAGPSSLAGIAIALTVPVIVLCEAGTAKDDMLGVFGLLASVVFLLAGADETVGAAKPAAAYGGLAAGLAVGSKLTFVVPVLALAVFVAVWARRRRAWSTLSWWVASAAATGSYWYVRNLIRVGNPLPGLSPGIGPVRLPKPATPSMTEYGSALLGSLRYPAVWSKAIPKGLSVGFGELWPVLLVIVLVSLVAGCALLRGPRRIPAVVGLVAFVGFFVTPGTVWGPQLIQRRGVQYITANFFAFNLRYLLPAIALGLATVPLVVRKARFDTVNLVLGLALVSTQLVPQGRQSWAERQVVVSLVVALVVVVATAVATARGARWPVVRRMSRSTPATARWTRVLGVLAVFGVLLALMVPLQRRYEHHRYAQSDLATWVEAHPGVRIGYSGFVFSYALYGHNWSNRVEMLGEPSPHGGWGPVRTCATWRQQVRERRLDFVMVPIGVPSPAMGIDLARWRLGLAGGQPPDLAPETRWTRRDAGLTFVARFNPSVAVYRVIGPPSPCT